MKGHYSGASCNLRSILIKTSSRICSQKAIKRGGLGIASIPSCYGIQGNASRFLLLPHWMSYWPSLLLQNIFFDDACRIQIILRLTTWHDLSRQWRMCKKSKIITGSSLCKWTPRFIIDTSIHWHFLSLFQCKPCMDVACRQLMTSVFGIDFLYWTPFKWWQNS